MAHIVWPRGTEGEIPVRQIFDRGHKVTLQINEGATWNGYVVCVTDCGPWHVDGSLIYVPNVPPEKL